MENAAEALKFAAFTLLFVAALSIAMMTIMKSKSTSEDIISYSDKTKYYSNIEANSSTQTEKGDRIVTIYDIIPTLYRYSQEKYIVLFNNNSGGPLEIYKGTIKQNSNTIESLGYLNGELEGYKECNWIGTSFKIKNHVDEVVKNLINNYSEKKFIESIHTTTNMYENNSGDNNIPVKTSDTQIKVITYTLQ